MLDRSRAPEIKLFGNLAIPAENVVVLSNGLTLHILEGGDQDVARLTLIVDGGSLDVANPCVATFAGELLREGNDSLGPEEIADLIDYNGAWLNSNAGSHYTSIRLTGLSSKVKDLTDLTIDCFTRPSMPRQSFEVIKQKAIARQKLNMSRVSFLAGAQMKKLVCGDGHRDAIVTAVDEIASIDRSELLAFHQSRLAPELTHAYLCGRLTGGLVEKVAARLESIASSPKPSPIEIVAYQPQEPGLSSVVVPDSLQSAVAMAIPSIPRSHPDYNALRMAVTALGGYFGSRLMMNIREDKGYTYGISSALVGSKEGSYIQISAQCDNSYTEALIQEVKNELKLMADRSLGDEEMNRLRFNVYSDLASTLDSPFNIMDYYELQRTVGTPSDYFSQRLSAIRSLTPKRICMLSERYLDPSQLRIGVAGSLKL